jgi:hypothetical protein
MTMAREEVQMSLDLAAAEPWTWGWDALVALGTMALALATLGLAAFTAQLASRTSTRAMLRTCGSAPFREGMQRAYLPE